MWLWQMTRDAIVIACLVAMTFMAMFFVTEYQALKTEVRDLRSKVTEQYQAFQKAIGGDSGKSSRRSAADEIKSAVDAWQRDVERQITDELKQPKP